MDSPGRSQQLRVVWLAALALGACELSTGTFAGKTCKTNVDCPSPYVCAQVRPEGRTCELVRGVETFDPTADLPTDYCHDVKRILDRTCVSNCHGTDHSYPGSPGNFRLDVYSTGTSLPGAGLEAAALITQLQADLMPPMDMGLPRPTMDERAVVLRWVNQGAPECLGDAGTSPGDAGNGDAGRRDGGDGG